MQTGAGCDDDTGAPYCTISAAIAAAGGGDTITLGAGTYTEVLSLNKSLTLNGAPFVTIQGDAAHSVISISPGTTVTIANVTITGGGNGGTAGGGIYLDWNASLTLNDVTVTANTAAFGGGIYTDGTLVVNRSTISSNNAVLIGGGIAASPLSIVTIDGSTIVANSGPTGGGINNDSHGFAITDSTIAGNTGVTDGAGINNRTGGIATVTRCTFHDNVVTNEGYHGGGIANAGTLVLTNSTFDGNAATGLGSSGGGLANLDGTATLNHVTIAANTASSSAGGIYLKSGSVHLHNAIVSDNTAPVGPDCAGTVAITSDGYNVIADTTGCSFASTGSDLLNQGAAALKLGTRGNNGGLTSTMVLLPGSVAIDAADPTGCPATDQRGAARPVDGNHDGAVRCDIGAYEVQEVIVVAAGTLITTEAGGTAPFTVVLGSEPVADVVVALASDDPTEGTVLPATLTFTLANWSTPQTVVVTGVDDIEEDGDVLFAITFSPATSADLRYDGLVAASVNVTNKDNDSRSGGGGSGGGGGVDVVALAILVAGVMRRRPLSLHRACSSVGRNKRSALRRTQLRGKRRAQ